MIVFFSDGFDCFQMMLTFLYTQFINFRLNMTSAAMWLGGMEQRSCFSKFFGSSKSILSKIEKFFRH